jgi:outer membrane protein assembly factor BamA
MQCSPSRIPGSLRQGSRFANLICCLALALLSSRLLAQGPSAPAAAYYEGQQVVSVSVVTNPHVDVSPLLAMVTQKPGTPYSQSAVDDTAATFRRLDKFTDVQVTVTPVEGGLHLAFLLQPLYYIGIASFPEAGKYFSYTRLLQVVNVNDQDPYDASRVPASGAALKKFLQDNGYFQAEVHVEPQFDDDHRLASIVFNTQMGKVARIAQIQINGTTPEVTNRLMKTIRSMRARLNGGLLKPGKAYSPGRIRDAIALMKRSLAKQNRLASRVSQNPPVFHAENNRVDVSFNVSLGPEVMVRITGARLAMLPFVSSIQKKKLIPIFSEGTIDRDLVQEGQQNLLNYFQSKGYFDVSVNSRFEKKPDLISVTYEINKGKKHKVRGIAFKGNRALSEDQLEQQLTIKKGRLITRGKFSQKLLKSSANNIEALYKDNGYEDVKVSPQAIDHEPAVDVVFNIEEGEQTTIANLAVDGNEHIPLQQLAPRGLKSKAGGPFSPGKISEDRSRIQATYLDQGYLNAEVTARITRANGDPHKVDVAINVVEHQRIRINDVVYLGQQHTRDSFLRKTADIPVESPLSQGKLLESESNLYNQGIFDWASVGPRAPITSQNSEIAVVKVHEEKRNDITYGFGFEVSHRGATAPAGTVAVPGLPSIGIGNNEVAPSQAVYAGPRGSIEFTRRNLRGLGESASVALLASQLDQRILATYTDPHLGETKWSSLTSISAEHTTENPLYAAFLEDASFQIERRIHPKSSTRLQLRYDFNKTDLSELLVPELVLPQDQHIHLSTFSGTLIRDTRDKPLDAHHGSFSTVDLGITPTTLGSSATFARLFAQYAFYKPIHSIVWANSIRLGLAKAFAGSFVPTSQLFFTGGGTTLRGFPINQAGPQRIVPFCNVLEGESGCVNISVPVGGRQLFILNSELRFPLGITKALGGVVFYDGGNVYSAINFNNFVNNYTNTVGIGIRYATPIGPVRLDVGRNLNPVPGINPTQYFITLGQAF